MIQLFQQFFFMSLFHLYAYAPPPDVAVRILHAAALIAYNEGPTAYAKGIRLGVSEKYASVADKVSGILFREALDSWLRQK